MSRIRNGATRAALLVLPVLVVTFPALAFGVESEGAEHHGGGHAIDGKTLALQLFNFGVLLFILVKYAGGALNKALGSRHEKMKVDLEEAERLRNDAEAKLKAQEVRLSNLEAEITQLRQSMKDSAEAERQRLVAAAEERAKRIEEETRFLLDQQVKQAELGFRAEVARAAARIAEDVLRRSINGADQQRLVSAFVSDVQAGSEKRSA
ncbi:MAG: ATP synthase F0 subunit B [Myxococcales bacterium]|nr:ATP synthase F0 subunit B [Myxococcales bacterium]